MARGECSLLDLPNLALEKIVSHLSGSDILNLGNLNPRFLLVSNVDRIWKPVWKKYGCDNLLEKFTNEQLDASYLGQNLNIKPCKYFKNFLFLHFLECNIATGKFFSEKLLLNRRSGYSCKNIKLFSDGLFLHLTTFGEFDILFSETLLHVQGNLKLGPVTVIDAQFSKKYLTVVTKTVHTTFVIIDYEYSGVVDEFTYHAHFYKLEPSKGDSKNYMFVLDSVVGFNSPIKLKLFYPYMIIQQDMDISLFDLSKWKKLHVFSDYTSEPRNLNIKDIIVWNSYVCVHHGFGDFDTYDIMSINDLRNKVTYNVHMDSRGIVHDNNLIILPSVKGNIVFFNILDQTDSRYPVQVTRPKIVIGFNVLIIQDGETNVMWMLSSEGRLLGCFQAYYTCLCAWKILHTFVTVFSDGCLLVIDFEKMLVLQSKQLDFCSRSMNLLSWFHVHHLIVFYELNDPMSYDCPIEVINFLSGDKDLQLS